MNKIKPKKYTLVKKFICDWIDKKIFLVHYRMLKICVRQGMVVEKFQEIIYFKQNKWSEKYLNFNTQKRNRAENEFEKKFYILLKNSFYGKTMENVRNQLILEFFKKDEYEKKIKQQSKLIFNGIHKSYENCDSHVFN